MAQLLSVHPCGAVGYPSAASSPPRPTSPLCASRGSILLVRNPKPSSEWAVLQEEVKGRGRHLCFFTDGRKQEQARKALESALGGKKTEFEKWNKEIEKRESGGGGASGGGRWFGGGGDWFGWSRDEHFWDEAKQAGITVLGLASLILLLTKGNVMFAVFFNSLLFLLRGVRNWFEFVLSRVFGKHFFTTPAPVNVSNTYEKTRVSAKERVVSKWGTDR
ncbi:hypothetical protein Taro_042777 [Colocasia esculenta]|uniref:Uncharacterized protein n=1 Tax=Colocasia esculenta TaxID=4460 RepID=A0A843WXC9_COLES|nr:hypothetical protein [Colocasia esculenta]